MYVYLSVSRSAIHSLALSTANLIELSNKTFFIYIFEKMCFNCILLHFSCDQLISLLFVFVCLPLESFAAAINRSEC